VQDSDVAQTATATKRINDLRRVPLDCQRSRVCFQRLTRIRSATADESAGRSE
jgi:hypothetical protein